MANPNWYKVFDSTEEMATKIPENTLKKADVNGRKICLINKNGRLLAVSDQCPHRKASLSQGKLNYFNEIICPLHEYRFDLKSGRETEERCDDLTTYPTEVRAEGIFIGI